MILGFDKIFSKTKTSNALSYDDIPLSADKTLVQLSYPQQMVSGIVAEPVDYFCKRYAEEIHLVLDSLPLKKEDIDVLLMPTINKFIRLVHLLPASENHHHSGTGGLLVHSLQCAAAAVLMAEQKEFNSASSNKVNHNNKSKWLVGACLVGLLHDVGKVFDMNVISMGGEIWNPNKEALLDWLSHRQVGKYFVSWDPGRVHKRHELRSIRLIYAVLVRNDLIDYLCKYTNDDVLGAIDDAIANGSGPLADILRQAEACSIQKDAEDRRHLGQSYLQASSPVFAAVIFSLRQLLSSHSWTVNEKDSPIFVTAEGVFLRLSSASVQAVHQVAIERGDAHVPATVDGMLRILGESGVIQARGEVIEPERWIWKFSLPALDRLMVCDAVKLVDPQLLFQAGVDSISVLQLDWNCTPVQIPAKDRCFLAPVVHGHAGNKQRSVSASPIDKAVPGNEGGLAELTEEECSRGSTTPLSAKDAQNLIDRLIRTILTQCSVGGGFLLQPVVVSGICGNAFSTIPIESVLHNYKIDEKTSEMLFRLSSLGNTIDMDISTHVFHLKETNNVRINPSPEGQSRG